MSYLPESEFRAFIGICAHVGRELDSIEKIGNALHDEYQIDPARSHEIACMIWNAHQQVKSQQEAQHDPR